MTGIRASQKKRDLSRLLSRTCGSGFHQVNVEGERQLQEIRGTR